MTRLGCLAANQPTKGLEVNVNITLSSPLLASDMTILQLYLPHYSDESTITIPREAMSHRPGTKALKMKRLVASPQVCTTSRASEERHHRALQ